MGFSMLQRETDNHPIAQTTLSRRRLWYSRSSQYHATKRISRTRRAVQVYQSYVCLSVIHGFCVSSCTTRFEMVIVNKLDSARL